MKTISTRHTIQIGGHMKYVPPIAGALFCVGALYLMGVPLFGLLLALAAGAAQNIPGEWGVSPDELVYGLLLCVPPLVTLITTMRILGNITLNSLAGGLAVPVFAGMHAVSALHAGAVHISGPDDPEE